MVKNAASSQDNQGAGSAQMAAQSTNALSAKEREELLALRQEVAALKARLDDAQGSSSAKERMAELITKAEMSEKLLKQYQAGLEKGLEMASSLRFGLHTPASAAGAGPP